jgi:hypothetical protein
METHGPRTVDPGTTGDMVPSATKEPTMALEHAIEIKITVGGDAAESPPGAVDDAVEALGLSRGRARRIWFLEDLTPGLPQRLPMLAAGQIFRVRLDEKKDGEWEADATVKLRPARRTQLAPPWDQTHSEEAENGKGSYEYRIEEDWAGTRRALAASMVVEVDAELLVSGQFLKESSQGAFSPQKVFTNDQQDYLATCADQRVVLSALTPLGPIAATRWETKIGEFNTKVERWTVEGLDFLELSVQLKAGSQGDPFERLLAFTTAVATHELNPFGPQETKTRRVLEHLAHRFGR